MGKAGELNHRTSSRAMRHRQQRTTVTATAKMTRERLSLLYTNGSSFQDQAHPWHKMGRSGTTTPAPVL